MIFGFGKTKKLRSVDKSFIRDQAYLDDYDSAEAIGRVRFGKLSFYYRDLGVKHHVPYGYIDRAFIRISECQPDDSPAYYYYRLILVHEDKEFANLIFNEEAEADAALERLQVHCPDMAVGFVAPPGKRKPSFK